MLSSCIRRPAAGFLQTAFWPTSTRRVVACLNGLTYLNADSRGYTSIKTRSYSSLHFVKQAPPLFTNSFSQAARGGNFEFARHFNSNAEPESELEKLKNMTWQVIKPSYSKCVKVLNSVLHGKIGPEQFHFFLKQDILFLEGAIEIFQAALKRNDIPPFVKDFITAMINSNKKEIRKHTDYLLNKNESLLEKKEQVKECEDYLDFIKEMFEELPPEEWPFIILSCLWMYREFSVNGIWSVSKDNPMYEWACTYVNVEFGSTSVFCLKLVLARLQSNLERMDPLFFVIQCAAIKEFEFLKRTLTPKQQSSPCLQESYKEPEK